MNDLDLGTQTLPPAGSASVRANDNLSDFLTGVRHNRTGKWAQQNYKNVIRSLIELTNARNVMEIGGGRWPLFGKDEVSEVGISYVVNDISESELSLAPDYVQKHCFNVAKYSPAPGDELYEKIDVMFSFNVFEHVEDVHEAYRNIFKFLAPGGVCLNYHPVLYSPPFVVNWLLPESMSSSLLRMFFPHRHALDTPKHPAKYNHCVINKREQDELKDIGYRNVWQIPFYYHDYFRKIPGLYQLDLALTKLADRRDWTSLASYSYTVVQK
jgi:2-polyprenyl-3-methyl-5-hydroxy-6-metoxy-1,4-benzoquinol methylase